LQQLARAYDRVDLGGDGALKTKENFNRPNFQESQRGDEVT